MDLIFGELSIAIIEWIQSTFSPEFDLIFIIISALGDTAFYVLVISAVYWTISKRHGIRLVLLMAMNLYTNGLFKDVIGLQRPYQAYPNSITAINTASGYSFPSGHSQSSGAFYTYIVNCLYGHRLRTILITSAVAIISLVSVSRLYLGVHYLGDVLVGAIIGIFITILFIKLFPRGERIISRWSDQSIVLSALLLSFLLIVLMTIAVFLVRPSETVLSGGAPGLLAGGVLGLVLEKKYVNFGTESVSKFNVLMRLFFGYILILSTVFLVNAAFGAYRGTNLNIFYEYLVYFCLGFVASFLAPLIFKKFELLGVMEQ